MAKRQAKGESAISIKKYKFIVYLLCMRKFFMDAEKRRKS